MRCTYVSVAKICRDVVDSRCRSCRFPSLVRRRRACLSSEYRRQTRRKCVTVSGTLQCGQIGDGAARERKRYALSGMWPVRSCVNMLASALDMFLKMRWIFGEGRERSKHFVKLPLDDASHRSVH